MRSRVSVPGVGLPFLVQFTDQEGSLDDTVGVAHSVGLDCEGGHILERRAAVFRRSDKTGQGNLLVWDGEEDRKNNLKVCVCVCERVSECMTESIQKTGSGGTGGQ